jgi:hypothetical protein
MVFVHDAHPGLSAGARPRWGFEVSTTPKLGSGHEKTLVSQIKNKHTFTRVPSASSQDPRGSESASGAAVDPDYSPTIIEYCQVNS